MTSETLNSSPQKTYQEYCARQGNGQFLGSKASQTVCRKRRKKGSAHPGLVKRVSWNPAEMREPWEEAKGIHSGCDEGGSAANIVWRIVDSGVK
jgi:hypothetical protein